MVLLIHVIIAISSLVYSTYLNLSPTRTKLRVSYSLIGLTFASGTYLVVNTRTAILHACLSGLAYVSLASALVFVARRKLAA